jgi:hypothetical protein
MIALLLTAALAAAPGLDRPPPAAFAPVRLSPIPPAAVVECERLQRRSRQTILCPARLPRATLRPDRPRLPPWPLRTEIFGDPRRPDRHALNGVDFSYGTPVEPTSGKNWWRQHLWWNRPCCFLHFGAYRVGRGAGPLPPKLYPVRLGGRRGLLAPATSHGHIGRGIWWTNHIWFFFRHEGSLYVASLHYFGRGYETRRLLARLIRELRPASELR